MTEQHEAIERQRLDDRFQIGQIGVGVIIARRVPVAFAPAALVDRDQSIFGQRRGQLPPGAGKAAQAVQQHDGRRARVAPFAHAQPQVAGLDERRALTRQRFRRGRRAIRRGGRVDHRNPSLPTAWSAVRPPRRGCSRPRVATAIATTTSFANGASPKLTETVS